MKIIKTIFGILVGIIAHKTTNPIISDIEAANTGHLWTRGSRYIIGVLATAPVFLLLNDEEQKDGGLLAYLLSFTAVGVGVAVGYWLDELE